MLDINNDYEAAEPIINLVRLLGKLRVAGLQVRQQSYMQQYLMTQFDAPPNRFCLKLAKNITMHVEYTVMVPWKDRDLQFEHIYE